MKWFYRFLIVLMASLIVPVGLLQAQSTGTITGTVIDASGAVVAGALLTVTEQATNLSRTVKSDEKGQFALKLLQPGTYTLSAEALGFKTFERQHIDLLVDQTLTIDARLEVGSTAQVMTVDAGTPQIDTMTGTLSQVIDQQRMVDLPLNGRNAATLSTLVAGAVSAPSNGAFQASTFGNQKVGAGGSRDSFGERRHSDRRQLSVGWR